MDRIASTSREYVKIPVTVTGTADPQLLPAEVAITPGAVEPDDADYTTAEWVGGLVRFLIGPGTPHVLQPRQTYTVWVRITSSPEIPVMHAGEIATY